MHKRRCNALAWALNDNGQPPAVPGRLQGVDNAMKFLKIIAIIGVVYVALALILDSAIGYFQPEGGDRTAVLRTFDAAGEPYDRVLLLLNDDGQLWVESGHWFRGWYRRALANPNVELVRDGQAAPYVAVPVNTPETVDKVTRLMGKGSDFRYWVGRTILMFAPIKPLRLDPVSAQEAPADVPLEAVDSAQDAVGAQQDATDVEQGAVDAPPNPAGAEQEPAGAQPEAASAPPDGVGAEQGPSGADPDPAGV